MVNTIKFDDILWPLTLRG